MNSYRIALPDGVGVGRDCEVRHEMIDVERSFKGANCHRIRETRDMTYGSGIMRRSFLSQATSRGVFATATNSSHPAICKASAGSSVLAPFSSRTPDDHRRRRMQERGQVAYCRRTRYEEEVSQEPMLEKNDLLTVY